MSPVSIPYQTEWSMPNGTSLGAEEATTVKFDILTVKFHISCSIVVVGHILTVKFYISTDGVVHAHRNLPKRRSHEREVFLRLSTYIYSFCVYLYLLCL